MFQACFRSRNYFSGVGHSTIRILGKALTRNTVRFAGKNRRFTSKRIEMKIFQADKIAAADC